MRIKRKISTACTIVFALSIVSGIEAHEGYHGFSSITSEGVLFLNQGEFSFSLADWITSIGQYHLLFLHFPIALVFMTAVAECLRMRFPHPMFPQAARFMILSAAIFAPVTALLGLALGDGEHYEGLALDLYQWHRYFGFLTGGLSILAAILKERGIRNPSSSLIAYYIILFLLFISVFLAGSFGGSLAFGMDVW